VRPRGTVKTPEGQQMVVDLLEYIERHQASYPPPASMAGPDHRKVQKMLGLE
jgi:ribosomal protein L30/L7E